MRRKIIESIIIVFIIGFWLSLIIIGARYQFKVPSLPNEKFQAFLEEQHPIIIDLRESNELAKDPLDYQPLIHLPFLFIEKHLSQIEIPQNYPVLFVCSDGNRARLVASLLYKRGCQGHYLQGGINSVRKNKYSVQ